MTNTYIGRPCKLGHIERYKNDHHCVMCARKKKNLNRNKTLAVEYTKKWKKLNPQKNKLHIAKKLEKLKLIRRKDFAGNSVDNAKFRAKKRNLEFNLDKEWARKIWTGRCALTNIEFSMNSITSNRFYSPSLDRIKPNAGYTKDNCRFVLYGINSFKGKLEDEEMISVARNLISNFNKK